MILFYSDAQLTFHSSHKKPAAAFEILPEAAGTLPEPLLLPRHPLLLSLQPNRPRISINSTCCTRAVWTQTGDRPGAVLTAGVRGQSQISRLRPKQPTRRGQRVPLLPPAPGALPEPPLLSRLHRMPPLQPNFRMRAAEHRY